ncbi:MAG: hypothetical protein VX589_20295 [Myxococcota bacterium]|nr:hypothetical protein [Myxococcota bacterium]
MKIQRLLIVASALWMSMVASGCGDIDSTSPQYDTQSTHRRDHNDSVPDCRSWRPGDDEADGDSRDRPPNSSAERRALANDPQFDDEATEHPDDVDLPGCSGPYVEDEVMPETEQVVFEVPSESPSGPGASEQSNEEYPEPAISEDDECYYECVGLACNSTCREGKLFTCSTSGRWTLEMDCQAAQMACELVLYEGGEFGAEHLCMEAHGS